MKPQADTSRYSADDLKTALGKVVYSSRVAQGLEQKMLAGMAGIGESHLRLIEKGKVAVTIPTLAKLASALDTTPADLFYEAQDAIDSAQSAQYPHSSPAALSK